jgi:hypothetical protein
MRGADELRSAKFASRLARGEPDADDPGRIAQRGCEPVEPPCGEAASNWPARASIWRGRSLAIDPAIAEAAAITQEIVIDGAAKSVLDRRNRRNASPGLVLHPTEHRWHTLGANCMSTLRL